MELELKINWVSLGVPKVLFASLLILSSSSLPSSHLLFFLLSLLPTHQHQHTNTNININTPTLTQTSTATLLTSHPSII
jgi:hypothetical protein